MFIWRGITGDAVVIYGEPLITKPMDTSGRARKVRFLLRFSLQHPGANGAMVAMANLRSNALIFFELLNM